MNPNLLDAERSYGINADINRSFEISDTLSLDLNVLLFYTKVKDPLTLVEESEDMFAYRQPLPYIDTRGTEINAVWRWNYLKLFLGYTNADVQEHGRQNTTEALLMPKERVNMVLVYEKEDAFRIGLESYYFSQQNLGNGKRSSDYWIFGLMTEKYFSDYFSLFLNFENFGDTRQTRDGPIYSGSISNPQFVDIYAPLDGFVVNGGIKLRF
jgi:iron complex outermembrane receptor protein